MMKFKNTLIIFLGIIAIIFVGCKEKKATHESGTLEEPKVETPTTSTERKLSELSQDELFEKLQNYKKLLDNGLIMQGEYDNYKKEILSYM